MRILKPCAVAILATAFFFLFGNSVQASTQATDNEGNNVTFNTSWSSASTLPNAPGNYYLEVDVTLSAIWQPTGVYNLDLNGHKIIQSAQTSTIMAKNATINVYDTSPDSSGVIFGGAGTALSGNRVGCVLVVSSSNGVFNLYNGTLDANNVKSNFGGVVYNCGVFNMYGGVVQNGNTVKNSNNKYGMGGGIFNQGVATLTGGTICDNNAASSGGGIYNIDTLKVDNCIFTSNNAAVTGGAIYSNKILDVNNTVFEYNTAEDSGGALFITSPADISYTTSINSTTFSNNSVKNSGGGGIYCEYSTLDIEGTDFKFNSSDSSGGALFCNNVDLLLKDSSLFYNSSYTFGGACHTLYTDITADNVILRENSTRGDCGQAGAWLFQNCTSEFSSCKFLNNFAIAAGALFIASSDSNNAHNYTSKFDCCTFSFNNTVAGGGGAMITKNVNTVLTDCLFKKNVSGSSRVYNNDDFISEGGAIHQIGGEIYSENTDYVWNTAEDNSGCIISNGILKITSGSFINNSVTSDTYVSVGAICMMSEGKLYLSSNNVDVLTFKGNEGYGYNDVLILDDAELFVGGDIKTSTEFNPSCDNVDVAFRPGSCHTNHILDSSKIHCTLISQDSSGIISTDVPGRITDNYCSTNSNAELYDNFILHTTGNLMQSWGTDDAATQNSIHHFDEDTSIWAAEHVHNYNLSAVDGKIVYSCSTENIQCELGRTPEELNLTVENMTYSGDEYDKINVINKIKSLSSAAYTVSYKGVNNNYHSTQPPINAGNYECVVTLRDVSLAKRFAIQKAKQTYLLSVDPVYEGEIIVPVIKGLKEEPNITYYYADNVGMDDRHLMTDEVTKSLAPGTYYITGVIEGTQNYDSEQTCAVAVQVKPHPTSIVVTSPPIVTEKVITSPPIVTEKVITSPPIVTEKVITSPPIVTEKVITSPPIVTEKVITSPPIVTEKVITSPPVVTEKVITSPPVVTEKVITSPPIVTEKVITSSPIVTVQVVTKEVPIVTEKVITSPPAITVQVVTKEVPIIYTVTPAPITTMPTIKVTAKPTAKVTATPKPIITVTKTSVKPLMKVSNTKGGKQVNIKWDKVKDATEYHIYVQYCGLDFYKKPTVVVKAKSDLSVKIARLNGKKINPAKSYKVFVEAHKITNREHKILGKTIVAHVAGHNSKSFSNVNKIRVNRTKINMVVKDTFKLRAKAFLEDPKKKSLSDRHVPIFRYATTNEYVATVTKDGVIKAKHKGQCLVYIYAKNGYVKKVKVTVR